jgi:hypothetical protein
VIGESVDHQRRKTSPTTIMPKTSSRKTVPIAAPIPARRA